MHAIEMCVRKVFSKEGIQKKSDHLKHQLISDIVNDDDVLFHWSMLAVNWDNEADALLPVIAEQWVTVRGFSFASAWMESSSRPTRNQFRKAKEHANNL